MSEGLALNPEGLLSPDGLPATLKLVLMLSALSLVPSLLMMTTCFVRVSVVLGVLRQALGTQQFLPNQVVTGLSLFLSLTVMWPVWESAWEQGIQPYTEGVYADEAARAEAFETAVERSLEPIRRFMSAQIELAGNEAAIDLFVDYRHPDGVAEAGYPQYYEDVPITVLLPAYVLSELKTAFLIGFQIYLPFVVIDLVIASLLTGLGLVNVAPATVALPCKLLLFVLVDGWFLIVELLLNSVGPIATG
ncbi:MAG: flagellar biosynthetic protein FliP [Planctomycetota bacterium]|nr:MAG: flagellar biosynthetic protein FliP [Planctomycetota bacterium]REJ93098.1 MAG: flagellar biosynthetic protein FliP [Planctomycetota bacterium]REK30086.1 MAG: flagellar biosynthetic protein FliP [Planctomycetota bacterium]REK37672.1 MAG: flagellar biosynthetic protein FliP [Planctomycetota bacterium]